MSGPLSISTAFLLRIYYIKNPYDVNVSVYPFWIHKTRPPFPCLMLSKNWTGCLLSQNMIKLSLQRPFYRTHKDLKYNH